jgi:hypothetical protein
VVTNSDRRLVALRRVTATLIDKVFWFTTTDSIIATAFGRPYGSVREGIMSPYHFYEILLQLRSGYDRGATILFPDGSGLSDS